MVSEVLEAITHAAADARCLPYATRQQLYEAAMWQQLPAIARLFLIASPPTLRFPTSSRVAWRPSGRSDPPAGTFDARERKALARTHDREQILLLLRDPQPAVVAILLDKPASSPRPTSSGSPLATPGGSGLARDGRRSSAVVGAPSGKRALVL